MAVSGVRFADLGRQHLQGRNVLIRVDFNGGKEERLRASIPSVERARAMGAARIFLLSHNGRPAESLQALTSAGMDPAEADVQMRRELGMGPIKNRLFTIYRDEGVIGPKECLWFMEEIRGKAIPSLAAQMPEGNIALLGNSRFYPGDVKRNHNLGRGIVAATQADIVVLDGFSVLHRAKQASVGMIARAVIARGGIAALGIAADQEINGLLEAFVENPARPYVGIFGGVKVAGEEGKMVILWNLLGKLDKAIIGGAMVYPFLLARYMRNRTGTFEEIKRRGLEEVGEDPIAAVRKPGELDADIAAAMRILETYRDKIVLPSAYIVDKEGIPGLVYDDEIISPGATIRDLEPAVLGTTLRRVAADARTFVFNGAVGWTPKFPKGTNEVFSFVTSLTDRGAITAIAGGDTKTDAKAAEKAGIPLRVSKKPSGGGAFMELLATGTLPIQDFLSQEI